MAETRDPLTVADEALAANVMTGSLDETTLTLTTRNGQAIRGVFQHSFLTDEQIRRLIEARRYVPNGGNADNQMRIGADGQTLEWFRPTPIPERVQIGPNLLDAEIPASTSNTYNLNDEIRLDKTFYFFQFGNEYFTIPASSDPLDSNGGSFVLSERTITITRGFDRPLRGIFFFIGAGLQGIRGERGLTGQGVPAGGDTNQILSKVDGTDFNTEWRDGGTNVAEVDARIAQFARAGSSTDIPENQIPASIARDTELPTDTHIRSLADERIAAHEADNTHPDDGLNQSQVDSRVVAGTKEFARAGGRAIMASDTDATLIRRINPEPGGNVGKIPIVNPNGNGYVLEDAPQSYTDAQADARVKAGVKDYAEKTGRDIRSSDTDFNSRLLPTPPNTPTPGSTLRSRFVVLSSDGSLYHTKQLSGFELPARASLPEPENNAGEYVRVNQSGTGFESGDISGIGINNLDSNLARRIVPTPTSTNAGKFLRIIPFSSNGIFQYILSDGAGLTIGNEELTDANGGPITTSSGSTADRQRQLTSGPATNTGVLLEFNEVRGYQVIILFANKLQVVYYVTAGGIEYLVGFGSSTISVRSGITVPSRGLYSVRFLN